MSFAATSTHTHVVSDPYAPSLARFAGLPGAEQILSGKVLDEMFRELRYTSRYIDEFNKMSLIPMNTLLGSSLSSWLVSDETLDKNPAVMNLRQLRETCESLQTIEEILTVRPNCIFISHQRLTNLIHDT